MSGFGFDLDAVLANMREQFDALKAENDALKNQLEAVKAERDAFERKYRLLAHHACNTVINKENQLKAANQEISRQKDTMIEMVKVWYYDDASKAEKQINALKAENEALKDKHKRFLDIACNVIINKENQLKEANQEISRQKDWMEKAAMLWFDNTSRISELERQLKDKNNGF